MPPITEQAVLFAADDAYALPVAVAGLSLLANCPRAAIYPWYVLDLGMTEDSKDKVKRSWANEAASPEVTFLAYDNAVTDGLPSVTAHGMVFPSTVFGYLHAASQLAARYSKVLYLDADVLVVREIDSLLDVSFDQPIAAVSDWQFSDAPLQADGRASGVHHPFNSGVLCFNSRAWKDGELFRQVAEYARTARRLTLPDQEALNYVLSGRWYELPYHLNMQVSRTVAQEYVGPLPSIYHYGGPRKPWKGRSPYPAFLRLYFAYARRSAFYQELPNMDDFPRIYEEDPGDT